MRIDYRQVLPEAVAAMDSLQRAVDRAGVDEGLLELIKIRASQINGCAYCVDMHTKDARALGEDEQRLHMVAVWKEASCFTERERAALLWAESLTLLADRSIPDDGYQAVSREFSHQEIAAMTFAIIAINGWNRLAVGMRLPVGAYVSRRGVKVGDGA